MTRDAMRIDAFFIIFFCYFYNSFFIILTRREIKGRAKTKFCRDGLSGCKTKIGEFDAPMREHEDIFWFEIAVRDAVLMAILDGIEDLQKDVADGIVIANKTVDRVCDGGKQIAAGRVLEDHKRVPVVFDHLFKCQDIVMIGQLRVDVHLAAADFGIGKQLGRILFVRLARVLRKIHNPVRAHAQNRHELDPAIVNASA